MSENPSSAAEYLPETPTYEQLSEAARRCEGCPLHREAERVVFGRGPTDARLMLIGGSPNRDDHRRGRPFTGERGELLNEALYEAPLRRSALYVTHAVKHIKWDGRRGKKVPQPPGSREIEACRPWLSAEIDLVDPECLVALGPRAAQSLLDRSIRVIETRGEVYESPYGPVIITHAPENALKKIDADARQRVYGELVSDLTMAADMDSDESQIV